MANGSPEDVSSASGAMVIPVYVSQDCPHADSVNPGYGITWQTTAGGATIIKSLGITFYDTELKSNLTEQSGQYFYPGIEQVALMADTGSWQYLPEINCRHQGGVVLTYHDTSGTAWLSYRIDTSYTPRQADSFFMITSSEIVDHSSGERCVKVEGAFACKLYSANGDSISISDGRFEAMLNNPV